MSNDLDDLDKLLADVEEFETKLSDDKEGSEKDSDEDNATSDSSAGSASSSQEQHDDGTRQETLTDRLSAVQRQGAEMAALLQDEDSFVDADEGDTEHDADEGNKKQDAEHRRKEPSDEDQTCVPSTKVQNVNQEGTTEAQVEGSGDENVYGDDFDESEQDFELSNGSNQQGSEIIVGIENHGEGQSKSDGSGSGVIHQGESDVLDSQPPAIEQAKMAVAAMAGDAVVADQKEERPASKGDEDGEAGYDDDGFEEDGAEYSDDGFEEAEEGQGEANGNAHTKKIPAASGANEDQDTEAFQDQLQQLQSEWMTEGSRQQRIYQYAVRELAKSLLLDMLEDAMEAADEQRGREETMAATVLREQFAGYKQLRECDFVREEKKQRRLDAQRKQQEARARREEEERKRLKERLRRERERAAAKDEELSASLARVREKRQKQRHVMDALREQEVQRQRERIERDKERAEERRGELQEFIRSKQDERQRAAAEEERATQERVEAREAQQEAAFHSMEEYAHGKRVQRERRESKAKEEWGRIKQSHAAFEDSLRQSDMRLSDIRKPRADHRSLKTDTFRTRLPPPHPAHSAVSYAASVQFSVSAYCSPASDGNVHPTALKRARQMQSDAPGRRKRKTFTAQQAAAALEQAFERAERWRPGQVAASDVCAALQRLGADVGREHMERITAELGVRADDDLSLHDFVEVGLAVISVAAPYQLVRDPSERSRSAEPLETMPKRGPGGKGGRQTMSAMEVRTDGLEFPAQDLQAHLQHAVKGRRAREREVAMLQAEALSILDIRKRQQTAGAASLDGQGVRAEEPHQEQSGNDASQTGQPPSDAAQGNAREVPGEDMEPGEQPEQQRVATWGAEEAAPSFGEVSNAKPTASKPCAKPPSKTSPFAFKKAGGPPKPLPSTAATTTAAEAPSSTSVQVSGQSQDASQPDSIADTPQPVASTSDSQPPSDSAARANRGPLREGAAQRSGSSGLQRVATPGSRPLTRQDSSRPSSRQTPFHGDLETETLDKTTPQPTQQPLASVSAEAANTATAHAQRANKPFKFKMPPSGRKPATAEQDLEDAHPGPASAEAQHDVIRTGQDVAGQPRPDAEQALLHTRLGNEFEGVGIDGGGGAECAPAEDVPPVPVAARSNFPLRPKGRNRPF